MKATELNQALSYADDAYLRELDTPEKEIIPMKNKKRTLRVLLAAALIALLTVTAYAAEQIRVHTLVSGRSKTYTSYAQMDAAIDQSGLDVKIPEAFANGFRFQKVEVEEVKGQDEKGNQVLTYRELSVDYRNAAGQRVLLCANPALESVITTESLPARSRVVGGIQMHYYLDHYKTVPANYQLTEADKAWEQQPGNYISYGSQSVEEEDIAFLTWTEDGVDYFFMDRGAGINANVLFAMAEEMIGS